MTAGYAQLTQRLPAAISVQALCAGSCRYGILAEAEQRGYLRGLNEAAEARMKEPSMYEQLVLKQPPVAPEGTD